MILVLSFDEYEQGTDPVIDWLIYLKANFVKVTINDFLQKELPFKIDVNKGKIWINKTDITDEIRVIWYRRFEAELVLPHFSKNRHAEQAIFELQHEIEVVVEFLKRILSDRIWMPHFSSITLEKPEVSYWATYHKVTTPSCIITNNRSDVEDFYRTLNKGKRRNLIIKPIRHSGYFVEDELTYSIYTQELTKKDIETLPSFFVLTMFQECIDAQYEVRTFYIDGEFYSTAIILSNKRESVDIKLSFQTPNINWIPYCIPDQTAQKIDDFMRSLNLNTASLDLLVSEEHYLLEINPVGQYSAPGYRCNYFLEEKIAHWLVDHDG